jgi:hypothetical protein
VVEDAARAVVAVVEEDEVRRAALDFDPQAAVPVTSPTATAATSRIERRR